MKNNEPKYRIIKLKDDELLFNDSIINKYSILIFKKDNRDFNYITAEGDLTKEWFEQIKQGNIIQFPEGQLRKIKYKKYIWFEDIAHMGPAAIRQFRVFQKIEPASFSPSPMLPTYMKSEITIKAPEDYTALLEDGYEIYAYDSIQQYKKDLIHYFCEQKELYNITRTDEEIYASIMDNTPLTYHDGQYDDILKKLNEAAETTVETSSI